MTPRPLLLACLLLVGSAPAGTVEPDVKGVVRALEYHYNNTRTLEADFVQRYTLGANTLVESGHVYFLKPGRMRWEYTSPEGKLFFTDGEYAYLYSPGEQQVRRQSMKKAAEWQAVFALLLGRVDLSRIFDPIQLVRVHRPDSPARWQLRGQAKSDQQGFHEVWLDLNDHYQLLRIEIRQSDGSLMEFHFRRWREHHSLSPELFRLQVPPGTVWLDEESF